MLVRMNERFDGSFRVMVVAVGTIGILIIAGACFAAIQQTRPEWLLVAAAALYLLRWYWRSTARIRALGARGFYVGSRVGSRWLYDELHDGVICSLEFPLEYVGRGEYLLLIPGEEHWRASMPPWAEDRREQITARLAVVFRRAQVRVVDESQQA